MVFIYLYILRRDWEKEADKSDGTENSNKTIYAFVEIVKIKIICRANLSKSVQNIQMWCIIKGKKFWTYEGVTIKYAKKGKQSFYLFPF